MTNKPAGLRLFGDEQGFPVLDLPKRVAFENGRRIGKGVGYRWAMEGLKVPGGRVVLESTMVGGRRFTTLAAVERFFAALTAARAPVKKAEFVRTPHQRQTHSFAADAEIDRFRASLATQTSKTNRDKK